MKSKLTSRIIKALVVITVLGVMSANMSVVNAATKTITCYKGTAVKKVNAISPKCPKGWSTKKPKAGTVAKKPVAGTVAKEPVAGTVAKEPVAGTVAKEPVAETVALNATYKGEIVFEPNSNDVRGAMSVPGAGIGTTADLEKLSGNVGWTGTVLQCSGFYLVGTLSGGGSTLIVKFDSEGAVCSYSDALNAGTFTSPASITGGTGKFAGATGTLELTGTISDTSRGVKGFSETGVYTITLSGNIKTK